MLVYALARWKGGGNVIYIMLHGSEIMLNSFSIDGQTIDISNTTF